MRSVEDVNFLPAVVTGACRVTDVDRCRAKPDDSDATANKVAGEELCMYVQNALHQTMTWAPTALESTPNYAQASLRKTARPVLHNCGCKFRALRLAEMDLYCILRLTAAKDFSIAWESPGTQQQLVIQGSVAHNTLACTRPASEPTAL
jgi:hypothetical protein